MKFLVIHKGQWAGCYTVEAESAEALAIHPRTGYDYPGEEVWDITGESVAWGAYSPSEARWRAYDRVRSDNAKRVPCPFDGLTWGQFFEARQRVETRLSLRAASMSLIRTGWFSQAAECRRLIEEVEGGLLEQSLRVAYELYHAPRGWGDWLRRDPALEEGMPVLQPVERNSSDA